MTELIEIEFDENIINKFLDIDGSLRDIYVNDTDINDWALLFSSLLNSEYSLSYTNNHVVQELPNNVESIFIEKESSHILRIQEENIIFNTHFFIKEQIEFDLNPRDFVAIGQSKILVDFMHYLSNVFNKEVIMTPENSEEFILIKVFPRNKKIFIKQS